jgi:hypothetical protein
MKRSPVQPCHEPPHASHGCVRLAPRHASILFDLVMVEGAANTRVEIAGMDPIGTGLASGNGAGGDYSRLTSFDPLSVGSWPTVAGAVLDPKSAEILEVAGYNSRAATPRRCHSPDWQIPDRRAPAEHHLGHDPSSSPSVNPASHQLPMPGSLGRQKGFALQSGFRG